MTTPLSTWTCDVCGELIDRPELGLVIWRNNEERKGESFRIVHKSGVGEVPRNCDPGASSGYVSNVELPAFLGEDGLAYLLGMLSVGPIKGDRGLISVGDLDEFVDLVRRVQTPFYEQARSRFDDEQVQQALGDASESYPYTPGVLERIAHGQI